MGAPGPPVLFCTISARKDPEIPLSKCKGARKLQNQIKHEPASAGGGRGKGDKIPVKKGFLKASGGQMEFSVR